MADLQVEFESLELDGIRSADLSRGSAVAYISCLLLLIGFFLLLFCLWLYPYKKSLSKELLVVTWPLYLLLVSVLGDRKSEQHPFFLWSLCCHHTISCGHKLVVR